MSQLIQEAFQALKGLNEDTFSFDKKGILDLSKFLTVDTEEVPTYDIIDPEAETEENLQPSYVGKAILDCNVCHQLLYKDPADVIIDEETDSVNVEDECPYCGQMGGFKVVGQVDPYVDEDKVNITVDGEDMEVKEKENKIDESLEDMPEAEAINDYITDVSESSGWVSFEKALDDLDNIYGLDITYEELLDWIGENSSKATTFNFDDEIVIMTPSAPSYRDIALKLRFSKRDADRYSFNEDTVRRGNRWVNKGKKGTHGTFRTKKAADAQRKAMFASGYKESLRRARGRKPLTYIVDYCEGEDSEWEKGYDVITTADILNYIDGFTERLNDESDARSRWTYNEDTLTVYNNDGQRYKFILSDEDRDDLYEDMDDEEVWGKSDYLLYKVKEDNILFFDDETGDIIIDADFIKTPPVVGEHVLVEFVDESDVKLQEFKFIGREDNRRSDGYHFEWLGVWDKDLQESYDDNDELFETVFEDIKNYCYDDLMYGREPEMDDFIAVYEDKYENSSELDISFEDIEDYIKDNWEDAYIQVLHGLGYVDEDNNWITESLGDNHPKDFENTVGATSIGDAKRWLDSQLKKYNNTYSFPEAERKELNKLIRDFGGTYFWNRVDEDFQKATVETGKSVLSMESDDDGKITVTSEPRKVEESEEEMISPVSDEIKSEIETDSEEEEVADSEESEEENIEGEEGEPVEIDIEEVDEAEFDDLGESYLHEVYDNVKSYKTIKGSINKDRIKLEGLLTFNSGKSCRTSFLFEGSEITRKGRVRLTGSNPQLSSKKNAFTITGNIKDRKLCLESFTYNYSAKNPKTGDSRSFYGTIRRK